MEKQKIRFFAVTLLALVGFFTGLNYFDNNSLEEIKGCFEFGFVFLLCGEGILKSLKRLIFDAVKNFLLLFFGAYITFLLPLTFFSLFCLNFKMGVFFACISKTLGFGGIVEIVFMMFLSAFILVCSIVQTFVVWQKNCNFRTFKHFDNYEILFILKNIGFLTAFVFIMMLMLFGCQFTKNSIFGFFNTYL